MDNFAYARTVMPLCQSHAISSISRNKFAESFPVSLDAHHRKHFQSVKLHLTQLNIRKQTARKL